jgi:paraquat-inducible protein B
MTETPHPVGAATLRRRRFNLIWLVPIVAAAISFYLAVEYLGDRGPLVTITFQTADGITAQQTELRHKAVPLGTVEDVHLSKDLKHAVVHIRMRAEGDAILTDRARFWVERPRLSAANISGLETLVSGAYIEVDPGAPGGAPIHEFTGLEEPPGIRSDEPGSIFRLKAPRLGSIGPGSPVFYRDVSVGEVLSYDLGDGVSPVEMRLFVRSPFDKFVHQDTHFWNVSGISVNLGAAGVHVELQSFQALLSGGVAFKTHRGPQEGPQSKANTEFKLFDNEADADAAGYATHIPFVAYFDSSVAGLNRGSPVEVFGLQIGTVSDVKLVLNAAAGIMRARVAFDLQPERLFSLGEVPKEQAPEQVTASLVRQGMRAVLESSNFLTGQKDIALTYVPNAPAAELGHEGQALLIPSQSGGLDNITASISDIATKLDKIPFDTIGRDLAGTLHSANETVSSPDMRQAVHNLSTTLADIGQLARHANAGLTPALARLPKLSADLQEAAARANALLGEGGYGVNSDMQRNIGRLLDQVNDAVRSIRLLADFLERHPEALIRGRTGHAAER